MSFYNLLIIINIFRIIEIETLKITSLTLGVLASIFLLVIIILSVLLYNTCKKLQNDKKTSVPKRFGPNKKLKINKNCSDGVHIDMEDCCQMTVCDSVSNEKFDVKKYSIL